MCRHGSYLAAAMVMVLGGVVLGQSKPADPKEDGELVALVKDIEALSADLIAEKPLDPSIATRLKAITYDEDNVKTLISILSAPRKDPLNLFVANKLTTPLLSAKPEIIKRALPALRAVEAKAGGYRQFRTYSAAELKSIKLPEITAKTTAEETMRQTAVVEKARQAKLDAEAPLAAHNRELFALQAHIFTLAIRLNDPAEDAKLVSAISVLEGTKQYGYKSVLAAISGEATRMDAKRALALYTPMKNLGSKLMIKGKYQNQAKCVASPDTATVAPEVDCYPGIDILTVVNQLATAAKADAVKIPTNQDVDSGKFKTTKP